MKSFDKAMAAYLAVCLFWGSTYLGIRIGVAVLPPFVLTGIRHTLSGLVMLLAAKLMKKPFPRTRHDLLVNVGVGLLMLMGANGLVTVAEQWVPSGIAALVVSMVPIYMALIERFVLRTQRISMLGALGLFMGFGGVYLLVSPSAGTSVMELRGIGMMLFGNLMWASGSLLSARTREEGTLIANIGIQMLAGGIGSSLIAVLDGSAFQAQFSWTAVGALAYLITFGSVVGFSSFIYLLKHWPAAKAGTYAYVNPVVAVILGSLVLGEAITPIMVAGMVVILFGVFLVQRSKVQSIKQ